jgi:hypothetical protein
MHSESVPRDYANLWPRVVAARFSEPVQCEAVMAILASYAGPEADRVKLGILKAADCQVERIRYFCRMASDDWRDLLCEAEYPLSSRKWGLKKKAPEKYEKLLVKEQAEYDSWLQRVLAT